MKIQNLRGGVKLLNYSKTSKNKNFAFSLIELSIVLIIIGLLVAGVTGGASLIESAKMKAFIEEVNSQKLAINVFYAAKGRYPGDIDNIGKFGKESGYTYVKDDFKAPFNDGSYLPNAESAPYAELYTEGIFDFKPEKDNNRFYSKIFKDVFYYFYYAYNTSDEEDHMAYNRSAGSQILLSLYEGYDKDPKIGFKPEFNKRVDEKIDDGIYNSGHTRSHCLGAKEGGHNSYDEAILNKKKCASFHFILDKI